MRKTLITVISGITVVVGHPRCRRRRDHGPGPRRVPSQVSPPTVDTLCDALPGIRTALATELDKATARPGHRHHHPDLANGRA